MSGAYTFRPPDRVLFDHPAWFEIVPADLSGADLSGADLSLGDFSWANFYEANLSKARLNGARLEHASLKRANLKGTSLLGVNLMNADLSGADLKEANLSWANLTDATLSGADLKEADLSWVNLMNADLSGADLKEANLRGVNLINADLSGADLRGASLAGAVLVDLDLTDADLTDCLVYGISAWNMQLKGAKQDNLIITHTSEPTITVDNLNLAQFIYLLLNNAEICEMIDTITSKVVLILGRFTPERKAVLDALREELRKRNYSPVLFDFKKPANRDLTETVNTLAHLARFIIVDLTDPSSAPHEVATVIPHTVVPVQPLLLQEPLLVDGKVVERREYAMFEDLRRRYHWVLPTFRYQDNAGLLASLQEQIITPAEQKAKELMQPK